MKRIALALVVLSGCTRPAPPVEVQQRIGPEGGSVVAPDGTRIDIPPGALSEAQLITLRTAPDAAPPLSTRTVGSLYRVGPEGLRFAKPVTATLTFDPARLPSGASANDVVVFTAPWGTRDYINLGTTLADSTHARAQTDHFSIFGTGVLLDADGNPRPRPDGGWGDGSVMVNDGGTGDLAGTTGDMAASDMAMVAMTADMASTSDMVKPVDMTSTSVDMTSTTIDMAKPADMATPSGDMAAPSGDMAAPSGDMAAPTGDMAVPSDLPPPSSDMFPIGPVITSLSPNQAHTGSADLYLSVGGYGFSDDAVVKANGTALTTVESFGMLYAVLPQSMLVAPATLLITITSEGRTSAPSSFTVTNSGNPAPTVTSISPTSIALGDNLSPLTVNGTGFVNGSAVFVGGYQTWSSMVMSPTEIEVYFVPDEVRGAVGSYPIVVQAPTPGGGASNSNVALTVTGVHPAPSFTVSPSTMPRLNGGSFTLRATSPSSYFTSKTTLTATYGSPQTTVAVGGCSAYGDTCSSYLPYAALQQAGTITITATTPAPGGGSSSATITVVDGNVLLPSGARPGSGDLPLIVWGGFTGGESVDAGTCAPDLGGCASYPTTGFSEQSVVKVNGTPLATTWLGHDRVQALLPSALLSSPGTLSITVATGSFTSAPLTFTIAASGNPLPTVSALDPPSTPLGTPLMAGLGIDGSNFLPGAKVYIGGYDVTYLATITASHIQVSLFGGFVGAVASYPVLVLNPGPGGGTNPGGASFAVTGTHPSPSFTVTPSMVPKGSSTSLLLRATGPDHFFTSKTSVSVSWSGGDDNSNTCSDYSETCYIYLPYLATAQAGTVTITATTPSPGGGTASASLTVVDGNVLLPDQARAGSGALRVTVWGGYGGAGSPDLGVPDFGAPSSYWPGFNETSVVKVDGSPVPTTLIDYSRVLATFPPSLLTSPGNHAVTVTTGANVSSPTTFTVVSTGNPLPTVTSVSPPSMPAGSPPMDGVTIDGSNFLADARVYIGGFDFTNYAQIGPTQIHVYVFSDSIPVGSHPVVVQNPVPGGGASSGSVSFTVE